MELHEEVSSMFESVLSDLGHRPMGTMDKEAVQYQDASATLGML